MLHKERELIRHICMYNFTCIPLAFNKALKRLFFNLKQIVVNNLVKCTKKNINIHNLLAIRVGSTLSYNIYS